jgi:ABC-type polar amino acid transport system ATPase subunit
MTILMVTHERGLAERFAQRIIHMADGRIVNGSSASSGSATSEVTHEGL